MMETWKAFIFLWPATVFLECFPCLFRTCRKTNLMRLSSVLNRLLFSINRRSDIILRIAKVREKMNKKMSVFCESFCATKKFQSAYVSHKLVWRRRSCLDVTNTEFRFYYLKQSYNDFPEDFYHCCLITLQWNEIKLFSL